MPCDRIFAQSNGLQVKSTWNADQKLFGENHSVFHLYTCFEPYVEHLKNRAMGFIQESSYSTSMTNLPYKRSFIN